MNGHRIDRAVIKRQRLVCFNSRQLAIVIGKCQVGHRHIGVGELRVELDRLAA